MFVTYGKGGRVQPTSPHVHRGVVLCVGVILSELYGSGSASRRHSGGLSMPLTIVDSLNLDARRVLNIIDDMW